MKNKTIFKNFSDYWSYAKYLTVNQRDVLITGMPENQRDELIHSFKSGGWEDLIMREELNEIIRKIKEEIGVDLLSNRCKIMKGKSVFIKKSEWNYIQDVLSPYKAEHTFYILGKVKAQDIDENTVLLVEDK